MTNVFNDQKRWMQGCSQTINVFNEDQFRLYMRLIDEEYKELKGADDSNDPLETLDALVDLLVVTLGAVTSMNADGEGAWNEVLRSNLSKIDRETGKVIKRESDGKVLKPDDWDPPALSQFLDTEYVEYLDEMATNNLKNKDGGEF